MQILSLTSEAKMQQRARKRARKLNLKLPVFQYAEINKHWRDSTRWCQGREPDRDSIKTLPLSTKEDKEDLRKDMQSYATVVRLPLGDLCCISLPRCPIPSPDSQLVFTTKIMWTISSFNHNLIVRWEKNKSDQVSSQTNSQNKKAEARFAVLHTFPG